MLSLSFFLFFSLFLSITKSTPEVCGSEQLCFKFREILPLFYQQCVIVGEELGEVRCVVVGLTQCKGRLDLSLECLVMVDAWGRMSTVNLEEEGLQHPMQVDDSKQLCNNRYMKIDCSFKSLVCAMTLSSLFFNV